MLTYRDRQTVDAKGAATWAVAPGTSFQLVPEPGNRGGFPLFVRLDDQEARTHLVTGPNEELGTEKFTRLQVLRATPGDVFSLFTAETARGAKRLHALHDASGALVTAPRPGRTLFSLDSFLDRTAWRDDVTAAGGPWGPRVWLVPTATGVALAGTPGRPWDVSAFRGLRFEARQVGASWALSSLRFGVQLVGSWRPGAGGVDAQEGDATTHPAGGHEEVRAGSGPGSDFGTEGENDGLQSVSVTLGALVERESGLFTRSASWSNSVRFFCVTEDEPFPEYGPGLAPPLLRLSAQVW